MQVAELEQQVAELKFDRTKWSKVSIGDIVRSVKVDADPQTSGLERYIAGEHMASGSLQLTSWGKIGEHYLGPAFHRYFKPGQVLFGSRRPYLKKVALADFEGICANTTLVLEPRDERISPELFPFIICSSPFLEHAIKKMRGSVNPYVNWSDLTDHELLLPTDQDQKRIADLLWAVEFVQRGYENAQIQLWATKQAFLKHEVIACEATPCEKLLLAKPRNGLSPKSHGDVTERDALSIGCVRNNGIDFEGAQKKTKFETAQADRFVVEDGDFLVVRGNGNRNLCGRGGLVVRCPRGVVFGDLLIRLRFDEKQILPELAAEIWNQDNVHRKLISRAKSTNGIYKINGQDILAHSIPVPPMSIQPHLLQSLNQSNEAQARISEHASRVKELRFKLDDDVWSVSA